MEPNAGNDLEKNVGGEEEDNAGGEGNKNPEEDEDEAEALNRSLGIPYRKTCDEHSHLPGKYRCHILHAPNGVKCNRSYCNLCISKNAAFSRRQVPYHFESDMCMVCFFYYKNHVTNPRDTAFTASILSHQKGAKYPWIIYHDHNSRAHHAHLLPESVPVPPRKTPLVVAKKSALPSRNRLPNNIQEVVVLKVPANPT